MSGRSPASMEMIIINTPSQDLVMTNFAYCSVGDFRRFSIPGTNPTQVLVGDSVVLPLHSHNSISDLKIGLNAIQRRLIKISTSDKISVGRFLPPGDFSLALLIVELNYVKANYNINEELDSIVLAQHLRKTFHSQILTSGQRVLFEFLGINYVLTVNRAMVVGLENSNDIERGQIINDTHIVFDAVSNSGIKIINQNEAACSNIFKQKNFNLQELGIGGLNEGFIVSFRRAFASRVLPPHVINKFGIKHVKGMLLYGPPGTGKTLLARQIGKLLNGREPKVVDGRVVLSKFVEETENNVRYLFADAEEDQRARGNQSDLHIIILDEIDAICKARGSMRDGTDVHDGIVNQLLTKIDGVESLDNVLLIGMTNRKDLLDEALLRCGRLEVHVEINLPNEKGRLQILQIHTNKLRKNSFLAPDVNLLKLAALTKNFSGAELEGLVRSSVSFALARQLDMGDITKPLDEESITVTMNDFLSGLSEIISTFGASTDKLYWCRHHGIIECGEIHKQIYKDIMSLVKHVKTRKDNLLVTCLLESSRGSGITLMAATIGIDSNLPYVKIVSKKSMVDLNERSKCAKLSKIFEDAYKSEMSIIMLDDIESLLEYDAIGFRYSILILETLKVFLHKLPPQGTKMLIIGITNETEFLDSIGICAIFSKKYHVPMLIKDNAKEEALEHLNKFGVDEIMQLLKFLK